jgi:hypothetical protein
VRAAERIASRGVLDMFGTRRARVIVASALAKTARRWRFTCTAPTAADTAPQHRYLSAVEWPGGLRMLAEGHCLATIDPGCNPLQVPTCTAPLPIAPPALRAAA